jgi:hypothetical protein
MIILLGQRISQYWKWPFHVFIFFLEIYFEAPNEKTNFKTRMSVANEGLYK